MNEKPLFLLNSGPHLDKFLESYVKFLLSEEGSCIPEPDLKKTVLTDPKLYQPSNNHSDPFCIIVNRQFPVIKPSCFKVKEDAF